MNFIQMLKARPKLASALVTNYWAEVGALGGAGVNGPRVDAP
jgi:hypothetical protein